MLLISRPKMWERPESGAARRGLAAPALESLSEGLSFRVATLTVSLMAGVLLAGSAAAQPNTSAAPTAAAAAEEEAPEPPDLPKSGVLSSAVEAGYNNRSIGDVFGGNALEGDKLPPISGSVVRQGNDWSATVRNNSEDFFNVSLRLVQVAANDSSLRSDFFSVSLRPGESATRSFGRAPSVAGAQLRVESWSWKPGKKKKGTPGPTTSQRK